MEFDVVIVGAGPSGLATAIKLKQLAQQNSKDISVCVLEKGAEVGAHILSGAVFDTQSLDELIPNWAALTPPAGIPVEQDHLYYLKDAHHAIKIPNMFAPKSLKNEGHRILSMGNLCRWLATHAEDLGVEIYPGFPAAELIIEDNQVKGVITQDMGRDADGQPKENFELGMALRATHTVLAEGSRGHLGKQVISRFALDHQSDPQHYAIGFKEIWDINPEQHQPGLVVHTAGWPLQQNCSGGGYLYHAQDNQVYVGLIVDLNYKNPHLNPFKEFQQFKHHPIIKQYLTNGKRVSYGARSITKGGANSLPQMQFPGGLIVGCDAGTLNVAKLKGNHTAMKSGMLAADYIAQQLNTDASCEAPGNYDALLQDSWLHRELSNTRNFGPALHKFGSVLGGIVNFFEQNVCNGRVPWTIQDLNEDYKQLDKTANSQNIIYDKPDNQLSFDLLSSVYLSNTHHTENQPNHLKLTDEDIPISFNLPRYSEPSQRFCPAGVYEIISSEGKDEFKINSQNCIHCKTCDIKDPSQNINWSPPEGGGGPNYPNM